MLTTINSFPFWMKILKLISFIIYEQLTVIVKVKNNKKLMKNHFFQNLYFFEFYFIFYSFSSDFRLLQTFWMYLIIFIFLWNYIRSEFIRFFMKIDDSK